VKTLHCTHAIKRWFLPPVKAPIEKNNPESLDTCTLTLISDISALEVPRIILGSKYYAHFVSFCNFIQYLISSSISWPTGWTFCHLWYS